jgi:hypothetical protein
MEHSRRRGRIESRPSVSDYHAIQPTRKNSARLSFAVIHKNLRNGSGIRSTSRAAAGRNVTDLRRWPSDATPAAFGYA